MPNDIKDTEVTSIDDILNELMNDDPFGLLDDNYDPQGIVVSKERYEELYGKRSTTQRNGYQAADGEVTAKQQVCSNFSEYEHLILKAQNDMKTRSFDRAVAVENEIAIGDVVVFKGLLGVVVAMNESEQRNSGQKYRAHIVYANGTESHLLLSTVVSNCYKDISYLVKFK